MFKLVAGKSQRKWKNEKEAAGFLKSLGLTDEEIFKVNSPSAAEKAIGKDGKKEIEGMWEAVAGKPTLVKESDKRPEIVQEADAVFNPIEGKGK